MPVERRERVIAIWFGSTGNGRNPKFNGRRQPSCGGTSRMMREYHVRICERLGVKFPGPTRQVLPLPRCNTDGRFAPISRLYLKLISSLAREVPTAVIPFRLVARLM